MAEEIEDIDALLRFDPMSQQESGDEGEAEASPNAEGAGEAGSQGSEAEAGQQSEDSAGADDGSQAQSKSDESGEPASGGEEEQSRSKEDLEEMLRQTQAQVQELQNKLQGQESQEQQSQSQGQESQDSGEIPDYQFQIPENITRAIGSDDENERAQGLNALVAGIGQAVHSRVREEYQQRLEALKQELRQERQQEAAQQDQQTQAEKIRQDYFGSYPHHDTEIVKPVVRSKSEEVMNEFGARQWTPKIRDEIAKRVDRELRRAGFNVQGDHGQAQSQKSNGADGQQKPPHVRRGTSRPAGSGGNDIEETLFG